MLSATTYGCWLQVLDAQRQPQGEAVSKGEKEIKYSNYLSSGCAD